MAITNPALLEMLRGAKNKYNRNNGKIVKLKEGKTTVRILQKDPKTPFWADLGIHWIKASPNDKPVAVVGCHDAVYEQPCPVCTAIEAAKKSAIDDESVKIIKEWNARKSVLVNALIRSGSDASDDPVVLELTGGTFGTFCTILEEYASECDVLDPETGLDFTIERSGKGLDTRYTVMPSPRSKPVPKGVLERAVDLREFIEKEYFRGEETKAINHIAAITGTNVKSLLGPRGSALLTSSAGAVAGAAESYSEVDPPFDVNSSPKTAREPSPAPAPVSSTPEPEATDDIAGALSESDIDDLLGELNDL